MPGNIYEWAGEYQQMELEKDGFRWPPAERIAENMLNFERGFCDSMRRVNRLRWMRLQ